jgi:sec-independent protein translocase protein TatA
MTELLVVLFVSLLVFGATRIPSLGDAIGRAVRGSASREARGRPPDNAAPRS